MPEPKFDYQALMFGFNIFQFLFTAAVAWYVRRVAKQKATETRFRQLEENMAKLPTSTDLDQLRGALATGCRQHKARTTAVEAGTAALRVELDHMPTQQQFMALNTSIAALSGELRNTQGRLEGINRAVDLVNEFLINQGGAKGQGK